VRWAPRKAESVLSDLEHIRSCRVVSGVHGRVSEIHVLAGDAVPAKTIVKSIESALYTHFGQKVDRRTISIAQIRTELPQATQKDEVHPFWRPEEAGPGGRMVLLSHQVIGERSQRVAVRVTLEHKGQRYEGVAQGADIAHSRLETLAKATLKAVEAAARAELESQRKEPVTLVLEGVSLVSGPTHPAVLACITATDGRDVTPLAGAVSAADSPARAAILATLQATDRWVRGQLSRRSRLLTRRNGRTPSVYPERS
jgi:hypothetical protein